MPQHCIRYASLPSLGFGLSDCRKLAFHGLTQSVRKSRGTTQPPHWLPMLEPPCESWVLIGRNRGFSLPVRGVYPIAARDLHTSIGLLSFHQQRSAAGINGDTTSNPEVRLISSSNKCFMLTPSLFVSLHRLPLQWAAELVGVLSGKGFLRLL